MFYLPFSIKYINSYEVERLFKATCFHFSVKISQGRVERADRHVYLRSAKVISFKILNQYYGNVVSIQSILQSPKLSL